MSVSTLNRALRIMGCDTGPGGDHCAQELTLDRVDPAQRGGREFKQTTYAFLHPSHQADTAHRPIGTVRLRWRRRFGYWGEQIGHLRDQR
jgi:hypothetical protein